ncbi:hypothetical protein NLI96_g5732 [Meripilus lineatus]|uniref:Uncharacterized protein n=1 Tax=Meripilus lineatus TaxID=2056292 RepID=A0AAD5V2A1_9APHY|nr:hypothetical protein NLI96_g5732 [Physisporinus lineatus]
MYDFLHFALKNKLLSGLVSLECSPDNNIRELERILKACSATLRHVIFHVSISLKYALLFPSLVNNIALETLHLNVSPLAPEAAHLLPHWLRKGTTRSFKVISFSYFSNFHDLTPEGFEEKLKELDEVLSSPAFPWLSRFQFQPRLIHHRPRRCEETQKKVRAIFPKLIKRGVFWIGIHMPRGQMDPEAVHVLPTDCDDYEL